MSAKILLIDDADMHKYGSRLLEKYVFEFLEVADGLAAVEIIRQNTPDLILADMKIPRLDGLEFLKILHSKEETLATPVIMLSARYGEDARIEAMNADDYIVKPFSPNELLGRIKMHLKMKRLRSQMPPLCSNPKNALRLIIESVELYFIITTDL